MENAEAQRPIHDPLEELPATARRIVETTKRLLIEKGYGYLSLENIANECGLNKTAVRYYFGNKAGLVELVVDSWVYENVSHLESIFAKSDERILDHPERLAEFTRAKQELIEGSEMFVAFFELLPSVMRDRRNSGRIEDLYEWAISRYARLFGSSLEGLDERQQRGFGQLVLAMVDGLGAQQIISKDRFPADAALSLFPMLLRGMADYVARGEAASER